MTVHILVDSTADIPPERARDLGITVVPLTVEFGNESFRDGVDMDGATFYRRLKESAQPPTTSTPPPGLFEEQYRQMVRDGATGILAMHIGSGLSATLSVSTTAAQMVTGDTGVPIVVLDSGTVSAGFGLPAEILARESRDGASMEQLKAHAESMFSRVHLIAVLDTLEYLKRGGRIGAGKAFVGGLLNVKPILGVRDSKVVPIEQPRTKAKALERVGQMVAELGALDAVAVAQADDAAGQQLVTVARTFWNGPIEQFNLGPVVGTHAGPGAGAIIAITKA